MSVSEQYPGRGDRVEEELERLQKNKKAIQDDLKAHGSTLSAPSQVAMIAEISSISFSIKEIKQELEDMGWFEFMNEIWRGDDKPNDV